MCGVARWLRQYDKGAELAFVAVHQEQPDFSKFWQKPCQVLFEKIELNSYI
jgi:hypothetical protein